ncbi:MAG TPA: pilus assembly protein N-terminal domain-containing protein [Parvularculaceae bacterium]|nr:pilus assembly protein N-terminal domain-containing protein [Parvularculaceae bacterium]
MRLFSLSLSAACLFATAATAEQVWVTMDQVKPYEFKQEVDQIVIGNPGIADITVRDKSRVLLFGKAPGLTNMFLFDADGNEIENLIVRVRASNSDLLTLQRGGQRFTYNCTSVCEQTLTIGDAPEAFGAVSSQTQQKFQQAASSAAPSE